MWRVGGFAREFQIVVGVMFWTAWCKRILGKGDGQGPSFLLALAVGQSRLPAAQIFGQNKDALSIASSLRRGYVEGS